MRNSPPPHQTALRVSATICVPIARQHWAAAQATPCLRLFCGSSLQLAPGSSTPYTILDTHCTGEAEPVISTEQAPACLVKKPKMGTMARYTLLFMLCCLISAET